MAFKVDFDFQQGMRSLGRMSRRAYDKVKDMADEHAEDGDGDADAKSDDEGRKRERDGD